MAPRNARLAALQRHLLAATPTAAAVPDDPIAEPRMGRIDAAALREFVTALLVAKGSEPAEAETVAAHLVLSNLKGHDSHGVGMLPQFAAPDPTPHSQGSAG